MLDVSEAGPWAKPPGSTGVVMLVFGVWRVMTGWPTVHGACCMVIATAPGMVTVPPIPKPAPPVVGERGTETAAYAQGAKPMQIFAIPDRPIGPPPGGPPEMPVNVPVRLLMPVKMIEFSVLGVVTGMLVVIGPNPPPPRASVVR